MLLDLLNQRAILVDALYPKQHFFQSYWDFFFCVKPILAFWIKCLAQGCTTVYQPIDDESDTLQT